MNWMNYPINRNERIFRRTGRLLLILACLWVACMILVATFSKTIFRSDVLIDMIMDCGIPILFLAIAVVSFVRIIAYMRWKRRYPYYFLFRDSHNSKTFEDE